MRLCAHLVVLCKHLVNVLLIRQPELQRRVAIETLEHK